MLTFSKPSPLLSTLAGLVWLLALVHLPAMVQAEPPGNEREPIGFDDFGEQEEYPSETKLAELLSPVEGHASKIKSESRGRLRVCQLSGLMRLNKRWDADSALRFAFLLERYECVQVHFWNGQQGVTLAYTPRYHHTWAAYSATREGNNPKPAELVLWATDGGRYRRCGLGTLNVHYGNGNLVLTRGDLTLLSVPFDRPPAEVFVDVEGSVLVCGLAVVLSPGLAELPEPGPVVFHAAKPAELDWSFTPQDGISWNKLSDGRVELVAEEKSPAAQAGVHTAKPGLYEFRFLVEHAEPGAGVYLGNDEDKQLARLAFFRHQPSNRTLFGPLHPGSSEVDRRVDEKHQPAPYAGSRQWFRLTVGAGAVKCWTSGDGVFWSQIAPAAESLEGACTRLGLYCVAARRRREIRLASIEVRRLETLMSLAAEEVWDRVDAEPLVKVDDGAAWEQRVAESRPADVATETWWRTCMVRTLSENPRLYLGQDLLDRLQQRILADSCDLSTKLRLLDETALLMHPGHHQPIDRLQKRYERLGLLLARQGHGAPLTVTSHAMLRSSLWTDRPMPIFHEGLLRHEIFVKLGQDRREELGELCRQVCYWNRTGRRDGDSAPGNEQIRHLAFWAEAQVTGRTPQDAEQTVVGPSPWRHPLRVSSTREGYNTFAEFAAALAGETYREACQILSSAAQTAGLGLLPDRDQRLWVSLPVAVALAMREHAPLREAMQKDFGPLGELRFKKAAAQGNEAAVAAVALQFYGTTAARDAHLWSGDRKLASGCFAEALGHYEQAAAMRAEPFSGGALARQQLAAAMLGRDTKKKLEGDSIEMGASRLSPSQYQALIDQLHQTRRTPDAEPQAFDGLSCFTPGAYQVRPWAVVDSPRVNRPDSMPERELDWGGRQMAVTIAGGQMFVSNQVDLWAFALEAGRQDWVQSGPSLKSAWPLLPMKPLVVHGRVVARRLTDAHPELACFACTDGRLLWSGKPDSYVASDPVWLGQDLCVLTVSEETADRLLLVFNRVDFDSGRVLRRVHLAEFDDLWQRRLAVQTAVVDDKMVVVGGGSVLCCDFAGEVHWIRRELWCPPLRPDYWTARAWFEQYQEPPLVADGRAYLMLPGSWCVECVELKTGRLVWRQAVPELTRLAGLARGRLILQTSDGLTGLETASGKTVWFHAAEQVRWAHPCVPDATILATRATKAEGKDALAAIWLDAETGSLRQESVWTIPVEGVPFWGPVVGHRGRQWGLLGPAGNRLERTIVELAPP